LKRFPDAKLVSVDWPNVLKLAEPTAAQMGLKERVEFRPGDIFDAVADEKRESERFALAFALTMLIWTQEGDTYTLAEYTRMLNAAGYRDIEMRALPGPAPQQAIVARR
jgi:hypothetical protein